jgi:hypothetical protein
MTCPQCAAPLLDGVAGYVLTVAGTTRAGQVPAWVCLTGCGYVRVKVEAVPIGEPPPTAGEIEILIRMRDAAREALDGRRP